MPGRSERGRTVNGATMVTAGWAAALLVLAVAGAGVAVAGASTTAAVQAADGPEDGHVEVELGGDEVCTELQTCIDLAAGLAGQFDEECDCWTEVDIFGFGTHSALIPFDGTVELSFGGDAVDDDACTNLFGLGTECETSTAAVLQDAPSGFCFTVTGSTDNLLESVADDLEFCAPL